MKVAVALVIALIIHSIAGLANALRAERFPAEVCAAKFCGEKEPQRSERAGGLK